MSVGMGRQRVRWVSLLGVLVMVVATGVVAVALPASAATGWRSVSAANGYTCGVKTDGTLWCWGSNYQSRLGLGGTEDRLIPTRVGTGKTWREVAAGVTHACALTESGARYCWGDNDNGQLGLGYTGRPVDTPTKATVPPPPRIAGIGEPEGGWRSLSAGLDDTCGITAVGRDVYCWGRSGPSGRLGLGDTLSRNAPVLVHSGTWAGVSARQTHTCALKVDGAAYCWGDNSFGQLGLGDTTDRLRPARVTAPSGGTDWTSIVAGVTHSCGIRDNGRLYCWGDNFNGRLGTGYLGDWLAVPSAVPGNDWRDVNAGAFHTCAVKTHEQVYCWGDGAAPSTPDCVECPRPVPLDDVDEISGGLFHTCAIQDDDELWCWGHNNDGELGLGDRVERDDPTKVG